MPAGTTWLDLVTLVVAGLGFGIAVVGLVLGIRTDRRESRTALGVEVLVGAGVVILRVTNIAQRRVTAQRTGFAQSKRDDRAVSFIGWDSPRGGRVLGEGAFPRTLDPGEATFETRAPLHVVKNAISPRNLEWAWCEDERGNPYWARVPEVVRDAVSSTKRRVPGPDDDYGQPTEVLIDDDA